MFEWISNPEAWVALLTLTSLEIVLGIDNIIVISILVGKLSEKDRSSARVLGLGLAMGTRILLLLSLAWMIKLVEPLFYLGSLPISGRDLILIVGGAFLIVKSGKELFESISGVHHSENNGNLKKATSYVMVLIQIALLDIVFSLDSVITAVAMAKDLEVMILAIIIAVLLMMLAANGIGNFVDRHPTIKNLALAFLVLVGISLIAEGFEIHIPKIAIYTAMIFSVLVEFANLLMKKNIEKLQKNNE